MVLSDAVVNCSAYRHGKKHKDMSIDDISEVLLESETFVWVGLVEPGPALLQKMQEEFGLHELAIEDAQHAHQRPKFEEYGETLFREE
jgi:magnesium transporter